MKIQLQLKVIANSSRSLIKRDAGASLKVYLRSPRERGKANEELHELFKKTFKPIKIELRIVSGALLTKKVVELTFATQDDYRKFLEELTALGS